MLLYSNKSLLTKMSIKPKFYSWFGFWDSSNGKECACNVGDLGLIPGLARSPGEGHSNPLQYSWLENPMDGRPWQATVHGPQRDRTEAT